MCVDAQTKDARKCIDAIENVRKLVLHSMPLLQNYIVLPSAELTDAERARQEMEQELFGLAQSTNTATTTVEQKVDYVTRASLRQIVALHAQVMEQLLQKDASLHLASLLRPITDKLHQLEKQVKQEEAVLTSMMQSCLHSIQQVNEQAQQWLQLPIPLL